MGAPEAQNRKSETLVIERVEDRKELKVNCTGSQAP
jgi:hypothetical protein